MGPDGGRQPSGERQGERKGINGKVCRGVPGQSLHRWGEKRFVMPQCSNPLSDPASFPVGYVQRGGTPPPWLQIKLEEAEKKTALLNPKKKTLPTLPAMASEPVCKLDPFRFWGGYRLSLRGTDVDLPVCCFNLVQNKEIPSRRVGTGKGDLPEEGGEPSSAARKCTLSLQPKTRWRLCFPLWVPRPEDPRFSFRKSSGAVNKEMQNKTPAV